MLSLTVTCCTASLLCISELMLTSTRIQWGHLLLGLHAFIELQFWCFLRMLNKLVVLLCRAKTGLMHSLHMIFSRLTSFAQNLKNFLTTDDDPFQGTSSRNLIFVLPVCSLMLLFTQNYCWRVHVQRHDHKSEARKSRSPPVGWLLT